MEMEIKVNSYQLPQVITFNFAELKKELSALLNNYENLVYSDEAIKEAKADRARLNKLAKALNDERVKREREYMQPFTEFKSQISELVADITNTCAKIDTQVKACEERQKVEKREKINEMMSQFDFQGVPASRIFVDKWLNVSTSLSAVEKELKAKADEIRENMEIIERLEHAFEAREVFRQTCNISAAIAEDQRITAIEQRKAEAKSRAEAQKIAEREAKETVCPPKTVETHENEEPPQTQDEARVWIGFKVFVSVDKAEKLSDWFTQNGITYEMIPLG